MENRKNKVGFVLFLILLLIIGVGGFMAMRFLTSDKQTKASYFFTTPSKEIDNRINKEKDYIYYDNITNVLEELNIDYKNIHVNLPSGESISSILNSEESEFRGTIKYKKDVDIPEGTEYEENEEGIYSLTYRDYIEYDYDNYITILIKDNDYNIVDGNIPKNLKSYVFDKKEDKVLTEEELLQKYNTNMDLIKTKIKTKLNAEQEVIDGIPFLNIDTTLNNFYYSLSINKIGKLEINYIVSSTKQSFYDNIVIN